MKCANQLINGEKVVDRKAGLYLCEKFNLVCLLTCKIGY